MSRRHNLRRLGRHRTYDARELAATLEINIATVRAWCGEGLAPIDRRRPFLFLGEDVARFLKAREQPRQPLQPGELYCVACRAPRMPAKLMIEWEPLSSTAGNFVGTCPISGHGMRRRVRVSDLDDRRGPCIVVFEDGSSTIGRGSDAVEMPPSEELVA